MRSSVATVAAPLEVVEEACSVLLVRVMLEFCSQVCNVDRRGR